MIEKIIKDTTELIAINTIKGNDAEIEKALDVFAKPCIKADVFVEKIQVPNSSPALIISNKKTKNFDVIWLCHLDIVPCSDELLTTKIEDGKFIGRGTLDMKTWAVMAREIFLENKDKDLKMGLVIVSDEETGGEGADFLAQQNLSSKIILDVDHGGEISQITEKCKNAMCIDLIAKGQPAHGSLPWEGIDAIEEIIQTVQNLRKTFPYYSIENKPKDTWTATMHVGKINGGKATNIIAPSAVASLDFRLTEKITTEKLEEILKECCSKNVFYEIKMRGKVVSNDRNNPILQKYANLVENEIEKKAEFITIGGATDSKNFADGETLIIMHSGTGNGMHADNEYTEIESIKQLYNIQSKFIESL
ncbi:MAG: M20 family metallopeptidase [Alphaproteobacteria bacterium]